MMTADSSETNRLLAQILLAMQNLDRTLQTHQTRLDQLESRGKSMEGLMVPDCENMHPLPLSVAIQVMLPS